MLPDSMNDNEQTGKSTSTSSGMITLTRIFVQINLISINIFILIEQFLRRDQLENKKRAPVKEQQRQIVKKINT